MAAVYRVPGFDAPIVRDVDVLVIGGGPAGVGAAISAARAGQRVLLAEHYGFLGGAHASGEIGTFCGLYGTITGYDLPSFIGRGINCDLLAALRGVTTGTRPQAATTGPQRWYNTYIEVYDPFWLRLCLDRLVAAAGVEVLLHATALDAITSGDRVEGALFATKAGIVAVRATVVIDASGDADLVARAGGGFRMGEDGTLMHPSMMFRMFGVDTQRLRYISWAQIAELMRENGERYGLNRFYPGVFLGTREGEVLLNVTKITQQGGGDLNPLDPWQRSWAEQQGREQCALYEQFFREQVPGFERARINVTAAAVAVRETRLIEGEYRLRGDDVFSGRKFADGIAYSAWPMEKMEGTTAQLRWIDDGLLYEVPYRCLIPQKLDGILVAGRCLSAERAAHASARTWAICMDMGEAAGLAAAQAVERRCGVREVDVDAIKRKLGGMLAPEAQTTLVTGDR
jgi:glycine/D-amino acid oxidase-like deaminating enzyme